MGSDCPLLYDFIAAPFALESYQKWFDSLYTQGQAVQARKDMTKRRIKSNFRVEMHRFQRMILRKDTLYVLN